jgi:hypothetical protein
MFEKIAGHAEEHCPQVEALREAVGAGSLPSEAAR